MFNGIVSGKISFTSVETGICDVEINEGWTLIQTLSTPFHIPVLQSLERDSAILFLKNTNKTIKKKTKKQNLFYYKIQEDNCFLFYVKK